MRASLRMPPRGVWRQARLHAIPPEVGEGDFDGSIFNWFALRLQDDFAVVGIAVIGRGKLLGVDGATVRFSRREVISP